VIVLSLSVLHGGAGLALCQSHLLTRTYRRLTLDPFTTLFFMTCSIGVIAITLLAYVTSGVRAETRFALVVSLLLIVLFFALSSLNLTRSDATLARHQPSTDPYLDAFDPSNTVSTGG